MMKFLVLFFAASIVASAKPHKNDEELIFVHAVRCEQEINKLFYSCGDMEIELLILLGLLIPIKKMHGLK